MTIFIPPKTIEINNKSRYKDDLVNQNYTIIHIVAKKGVYVAL